MKCYIIIPTYNNATIITEALSSIAEAETLKDWQLEIIISDDGSTDKTVERAQQVCSSESVTCTILQGAHSGAAGARNRALARVAKSEESIVLFLQADTPVRPSTIKKHLELHEQQPENKAAALGVTMWDPRCKPTPFMEWMTHGGPQNSFDELLSQAQADPRKFFYGANISLKSSMVENFAEDFTSYGWEDAELGARLADKGLVLHVLHHAVVLHHHHYSISDIKSRQIAVGQNRHTYEARTKSKTMTEEMPPAHRLKYQLLNRSGAVYIAEIILKTLEAYSTPWLYKVLTTSWFWQGYWAGVKK